MILADQQGAMRDALGADCEGGFSRKQGVRVKNHGDLESGDIRLLGIASTASIIII
jgi:hypothetical protein